MLSPCEATQTERDNKVENNRQKAITNITVDTYVNVP